MAPDDREIAFEFREEIDRFSDATISMMGEIQRTFVKQRLPEENMQRYRHGDSWTSRANPTDKPPVMQKMSSSWEVRFDDIIRGDLSLIDRSITQVTNDLQRQFIEMLYQTISDSCSETGNVIDAKQEGSFPQGFLAMLRKIEFGVGRDGKVSIPELHLSAQTGPKLIAQLEAQPPEFGAEIERIKAEKIALAMQKERDRKARFKGYSG